MTETAGNSRGSPLEAFAGNQSVSFPQPLWYFAYRFFSLCNRRGLSSGSPLLAEMNGLEGGWVRFPGRAGGEGHKRRFPGKEEKKKVLSSRSTCFPRHWKSRPAQRITGAI